MDCSEIRDRFLKGEAVVTEQVQRHLTGCPECQALFEGGAQLGHRLASQAASALPFPDELFAQTEASVAAEIGPRAWLRSRPTHFQSRVVALGVLCVVLLGGVARLRPDFAEYPSTRLLLLFGVSSCLILVAFRKGLRFPARLGNFGDHPEFALAALGIPFLLAFAPATEVSRQASSGGALNCFVYGALFTVPLALLLWACDRNDRPSQGTVCLAAVGLGLSANLVLELHCPNGNAVHLLLGHASIGILWLVTWAVLRVSGNAARRT